MAINRNSITYKYLNVFILFIVIPIIIMSVIINKIYINTLLMSSSESILQAMEQIALGVDNETKRISLLASTISNDDDLMKLVTDWNRSNDPNARFDLSSRIDSKLNALFNYSNDVESVMFFFKGMTPYYYKSDATLSIDEIKAMPWYEASLEDKGKTHILGSLKSFTTNSRYEYVISVAISPEIPAYRNDTETIYMAFHSNILNSFYSGMKYKKVGELLLLDSDNRIMVAKNEKLLGKDVEELGLQKDLLTGNTNVAVSMLDGSKKFITAYTISKTGWHIVNLIDYKELTSDIDRILVYVILIFVAITALFFLFSIHFFRNIIIPVNHLIQKMKQVEKGDFNTYVDIKRDDEIYLLGKSFNRMVQEIKNLIRERDIIAAEKSKAEIEVLQSQINPHFISNTLNSIRLMAMIAKVDSVKNMVEAFMKLLLASFSRTGKLIKVEEELDILKSYIYILKVRYGDKFDVNIECEEEIKGLYILRLLLQPILENAIFHGISELESKGLITVRGCRTGDDIIFSIKDNGVGMTQEQIDRLLSEDSHNAKGFSSIGILNVDRRIKLNYGAGYGLKIESGYGEYTEVSIKLPVILSDNEEVKHA